MNTPSHDGPTLRTHEERAQGSLLREYDPRVFIHVFGAFGKLVRVHRRCGRLPSSRSCIILDLRGAWASGYRGYLAGELAPTNLNTTIQRVVAVRWHGDVLTQLGDGVAYAVTPHAFAAGATAIAGRFDTMTTNFFGNPGGCYDSPVPHAVTWDAVGRRSSIRMDAVRSVAYDVASDRTVVGMLQAHDAKHSAFHWHHGGLQRLDDLPHPAGWRFESAYATADDGTITGPGTMNRIVSVFRWRPSG